MMLRPESARAQALVQTLRSELARDLPRQLELMHADGETLLDPALVDALQHSLPEPAPLSDEQCEAIVRSYTGGPRTFESIAAALMQFVRSHQPRLDRLTPSERTLIERRVLAADSWPRATEAAALPSVPAAMRALRRAVRQLL